MNKLARDNFWSMCLNVEIIYVGKILDKLPEGDGQEYFVNRQLPKPLEVKVYDGETRQPLANIDVQFSTIATPIGGGDAMLSAGSVLTDSAGIARVDFTLGSTTGTYKVKAYYAECAGPGKKEATFTETAVTVQQTTRLTEVFCDGSFFVGNIVPYDLRVKAINDITGQPVSDYEVSFELIDAPDPVNAELLIQSTATSNYGIARTNLKLGNTTGIYRFRAFCNDCLANQEIICPVEGIAEAQIKRKHPDIAIFQQKKDVLITINPSVVAPHEGGSLRFPRFRRFVFPTC